MTHTRKPHAQITGKRMSVMINEPNNAKIIVSAIGVNSFPEGPDST